MPKLPDEPQDLQLPWGYRWETDREMWERLRREMLKSDPWEG